MPRPDDDPFELTRRWEIGFTYGSAQPSKLWKLPIPRIGLAYQNVDGFRFVFSYAY